MDIDIDNINDNDSNYDILNSYNYKHYSYNFLDRCEKILLMTISGYNPCYASLATLAKECPMSLSKVKETIESLIKKNIIIRTKKQNSLFSGKDTNKLDINRIEIGSLLDKYTNILTLPRATMWPINNASKSHIVTTPQPHSGHPPSHIVATKVLNKKVLNKSINTPIFSSPESPTKEPKIVSEPTKTKKPPKVKDYNNAIDLLRHWNAKKIVVHDMRESLIQEIDKILRKSDMPLEAYKTAIDNYSHARGIKSWREIYTWNLTVFMTRKTCTQFYGENFILSNYQTTQKSATNAPEDGFNRYVYDLVMTYGRSWPRDKWDSLTSIQQDKIRSWGHPEGLAKLSEYQLKEKLGLLKFN